MEEKIIAYKGFDANWKCRDFQYEVGKSYAHDGKVEACNAGFHACEYPLDVFNYYPPAGSQFAVVEQSGKLARHDEDSKVASSAIVVRASISISGLVQAAIEYTQKRCTPIDSKSPASSTGSYGAANSTGKHSVAMACGVEGRVMGAEGCGIVAVFRGDDGEIVQIRAAIVGRDGVKAGVWYRLDESGAFVES